MGYLCYMLTDAHCHPGDLLSLFPGAEDERRRLGIAAAASSTGGEEFKRHEDLARHAREDGAAPLLRCFAVHPQFPAAASPEGAKLPPVSDLTALLETFAAEKRLDAVGETGFDLYDHAFRETEALQDELFRVHLETALRYDLPLVLHVRRAIHKIFLHARELRKISGVILHSYPGTPGEGEAFLRRGINVFFSFGTALLLNHKQARRSCAALPQDRLLLETDAPYQPPRGKQFSSWADLPLLFQAAAALRREAGNSCGDPAELEHTVEENFFRAFQYGKRLWS
jgi:TatD DNase family protein